MAEEEKDHKIQIWVAIIGFVGVMGAAIISNWSTLTSASNEKKPKVIATIETKKLNSVKPALDSVPDSPVKFQKYVANKYGCNTENTTFLETSVDSEKYVFNIHYTAQEYDVGFNEIKLKFIELEDWNLSKNPPGSWLTKFINVNKYIVPAGKKVVFAATNFAYKIKKSPKDFGVRKYSSHFALIWQTKAKILKTPINFEEANETDCVFIRIIPESGTLYRNIEWH